MSAPIQVVRVTFSADIASYGELSDPLPLLTRAWGSHLKEALLERSRPLNCAVGNAVCVVNVVAGAGLQKTAMEEL